MERRITAAVVALTAALLAAIAVPLGLITAAQDRRDFRSQSVSSARTLASIAEEALGDHRMNRALASSITQLGRGGDQIAVYDRAGRRQAGTKVSPAVAPAAIRQVAANAATEVRPAGGRLLVLAPVRQDEGDGTVGTIALSRSNESLEHRLIVLWGWLGGVSAAGLLAAALVATALARWVSSPLSTLEAAAGRLGDGALDTRSPTGAGPSEVRRLAANFNTMAGRLEALVHDHRAMMADVSHQLRTPLAALRLRLDVLAQDAGRPVADELAGAQEEIARLSRMVDGLLAVARAENTVTEPVLVQVDMVIRDRAAAWRPAAEERHVTLAEGSLVRVRARLGEGHLEQVLDNLLDNALEAARPGGTITVSALAVGAGAGLRATGGRATGGGRGARIVVADDGPGMSAQQQRSAFRRFATSTAGGAGLGLAIVHRLVTSNGGSATLSDTPGGGLTVTIELPAAPRERGARRPAALSP